MKLSNEVKLFFYQFLVNEISLLDFEEWVYENEQKLAKISEELSFELISFDYKKYKAKDFMYSYLYNSVIDKGDFSDWGLRRQLRMIAQKGEWRSTLHTLYFGYWDDNVRFSFLLELCDYIAPIILSQENFGFTDFQGEVKERIIEEYLYPAILLESKKLLAELEAQKIVITGENTFTCDRIIELNDSHFKEILHEIKQRLK